MSLVVTIPADDRNLLTPEQMRLAAGLAVDDESMDEALAILNGVVSDQICDACAISIGNGAGPTLRRETLTETFRSRSIFNPRQRRNPPPLYLSRRHDVEIVSITRDDVEEDAASYSVESEAGLVYRLARDTHEVWTGREIVVVYEAGFETVPDGLVGAASDLVRHRRSEVSRDPMTKSHRVQVMGVDEVETQYWVNAAGSSAYSSPIPPDIAAKLARYMNAVRL